MPRKNSSVGDKRLRSAHQMLKMGVPRYKFPLQNLKNLCVWFQRCGWFVPSCPGCEQIVSRQIRRVKEPRIPSRFEFWKDNPATRLWNPILTQIVVVFVPAFVVSGDIRDPALLLMSFLKSSSLNQIMFRMCEESKTQSITNEWNFIKCKLSNHSPLTSPEKLSLVLTWSPYDVIPSSATLTAGIFGWHKTFQEN